MSHKISILFPLLGLSCAQQFNHGMLPSNQGASTRQEQYKQPYGAAAYDPVAQQEYDQKFEKAFKNRSFKDIPALANDPRLVFYGNVTLLLGMLHIIIPDYIASKGNTCELLLNRLLALEAAVYYKGISQPNIAKEGLTLLQLAIQYNRTGIALKLINKFKEVSEPKRAAIMNAEGGKMHRTALDMAVEKKNYAVMGALLSVPGIDVTAKSPRSESEKQEIYESAFMRAVLSRAVRKICPLVKYTRVHKLRNIRGIIYALYYILRAPHSDDNATAASVLTDRFVKEKDFRSQEFSEENGNMYNYVDKYNQLLKLAIENNYEKIVTKLIKNIKHQDDPVAIINYTQRLLGEPLLHYLIKLTNQKKKKWVEMLLDVPGINLDLQGNSDCTPLHEAIKIYNQAIVTLLLNKGATVNIQDEHGYTPLHEACKCSNQVVVTLLLAKGARVDLQDKSGCTPLHEASKYSNYAVVTLLLAKGATVDLKNKSGCTPLHEASKLCNYGVVKLLLAKGARVDVEDHSRSTPLDCACSAQSVESSDKEKVIKLLADYLSFYTGKQTSGEVGIKI